jgi:hypothetical protein
MTMIRRKKPVDYTRMTETERASVIAQRLEDAVKREVEALIADGMPDMEKGEVRSGAVPHGMADDPLFPHAVRLNAARSPQERHEALNDLVTSAIAALAAVFAGNPHAEESMLLVSASINHLLHHPECPLEAVENVVKSMIVGAAVYMSTHERDGEHTPSSLAQALADGFARADMDSGSGFESIADFISQAHDVANGREEIDALEAMFDMPAHERDDDADQAEPQ